MIAKNEPCVRLASEEEFSIISWNLLREKGAKIEEVVTLIAQFRPDVLLMQEAVAAFDRLPELIGGSYARTALPGRIHGTACWSRWDFSRQPVTSQLPAGLIVRRHAQLIDFGSFSVANVHLSHGQILNRRQLRQIAPMLRPRAIVMGDFNLVGPTLLPGFVDVGPRGPTHRMAEILPIRIDRCLVRGMSRHSCDVLPHFGSDHHPIRVSLTLDPPTKSQPWIRFKDKA